MPDLPKISVITPSFNQAKFLEDTIRSVLLQEYPNLEYIVIDGGSTDGSVDIIKKYSDDITYWHSAQDGGQSDAINQGFQKATGDIVAWLNSDDLYLPHTLNRVAEQFQRNPDLDLLYGDCVFVDDNGSFIRYFTECEPYSKERLLNHSDFIMQPTTFFNRSTLFRIGLLNKACHYTMDWDLWCRFAINDCNVRHVSHVLAANREYEETKTSSGGMERMKEIWRIQKKYKTGLWPHAYFSFLATELWHKSSKARSKLFKGFGSLVAHAALCCSPQTILYRLRTKPMRKPLYGLFPHSAYCAESIDIRLPFFCNPQDYKLVIEVECKPKSSSDINEGKIVPRINGVDSIPLHIDNRTTSHRIEKHINDIISSDYKHEIRVEISFEGDDLLYCCNKVAIEEMGNTSNIEST